MDYPWNHRADSAIERPHPLYTIRPAGCWWIEFYPSSGFSPRQPRAHPEFQTHFLPESTLPQAQLSKGTQNPVYRSHAHLLVHKLIELSKGPERIQFFLRELPKHKNSARAFGVAFGHESMLKIEQWWSMAQIQFRSRDAFHRWRPEVILVHLSDCLQIETELPPGSPQAKPKTQRIPLQTYLRTDPTPQERALKLTPVLQRLAFLQDNSTPETARLIQDYRETLGAYLGLRSTKIHRAIRTKPTAQAVLRDRAITKLNLLDTILADMSPPPGNSLQICHALRSVDSPPPLSYLTKDVVRQFRLGSPFKSTPETEGIPTFRPRDWADVAEADWEDWRWQLKNRVSSLEGLQSRIPDLTPQESEGARLADTKLAMAITPHFLISSTATIPIARFAGKCCRAYRRLKPPRGKWAIPAGRTAIRRCPDWCTDIPTACFFW